MASTPEDKRAKLARLLREKTEKPKLAPVSFAQERFWFLDQWSAGAANQAVAVRLAGDLDREALERSLEAIVQRHGLSRIIEPDLCLDPQRAAERMRPAGAVFAQMVSLHNNRQIITTTHQPAAFYFIETRYSFCQSIKASAAFRCDSYLDIGGNGIRVGSFGVNYRLVGQNHPGFFIAGDLGFHLFSRKIQELAQFGGRKLRVLVKKFEERIHR